jgi:hypothetical protein
VRGVRCQPHHRHGTWKEWSSPLWVSSQLQPWGLLQRLERACGLHRIVFAFRIAGCRIAARGNRPCRSAVQATTTSVPCWLRQQNRADAPACRRIEAGDRKRRYEFDRLQQQSRSRSGCRNLTKSPGNFSARSLIRFRLKSDASGSS